MPCHQSLTSFALLNPSSQGLPLGPFSLVCGHCLFALPIHSLPSPLDNVPWKAYPYGLYQLDLSHSLPSDVWLGLITGNTSRRWDEWKSEVRVIILPADL